MTAPNTPAEPVVIRRRTMVYPNNGTPHEMTGWSYKPYTKHEYEGQVDAARLFVGDQAVRVETTVELLYASPQPAAQQPEPADNERSAYCTAFPGAVPPDDAARWAGWMARAALAAQQPDTPPADEFGYLNSWLNTAREIGEGECPLADRMATRLMAIAEEGDLPVAAQQPVAVPEGFALVPSYRGYAHLGIGRYLINHSAAGSPAELVISLATKAEWDGREVGEERDNEPGAMIQPEAMAVRMCFENVAGLDALETQLRYVREVHFPESIAAAPQAPSREPLTDEQLAWAEFGPLIDKHHMVISPPESRVHRNGGPNAGWGQSGLWRCSAWKHGIEKRPYHHSETSALDVLRNVAEQIAHGITKEGGKA
jgi:hypothetical protein